MSTTPLPALPLAEWEPTKETLHLYLQVLGKIRLACTHPRNHWWNVPLYVSPKGLTTGRLRYEGVDFQIDMDLVEHRVEIVSAVATKPIELRDGLSVADFYQGVLDKLAEIGVRPEIRPVPFGIPVTTAFPEDSEHDSYQADAVFRFGQILREVSWTFEEFAGWFGGKSSPVHLFWHSLDLAVTRFCGRAAPVPAEADPVNREAYCKEVISFGFWAGDHEVREPMFYSYTSPTPAELTSHPLRPEAAFWVPERGMALYPYEDMRSAAVPRIALLDFLHSSYQAGATAANWAQNELASSWHPDSTGSR